MKADKHGFSQFRMERLSRPVTELQRNSFEVVIIGSGYGGSIAASRMARAGKSVCLLERGREIHPGEYPKSKRHALKEMQVDTQKAHLGSSTALYDFRVNDDVHVFIGCGLGGTSLVNAGVSLRAEPRVFLDPRWPEELRNDAAGLFQLDYVRAEQMLQPQAYPKERPDLKKLEALKRSATALSAQFYRPSINVTFADRINAAGVLQYRCSDCGDCVSGCNVGAKNTTLMNYLPDAKHHGAEIYTEAKVTHIRQRGQKWIVYLEPQCGGEKTFNAPEHFVLADVVILGCGTLGSTEILLRSRVKGLSVSKMLGVRFTGNGDALGIGYNTDTRIQGIGLGHRHVTKRKRVGPTITGIIDLRDPKQALENGIVIEEGTIPGALAKFIGWLLPLLALFFGHETRRSRGELFRQTRRALRSVFRGPYTGAVRNTQTYLVMSHDKDGGRMFLDNDRIRIRWPHVGEDWNFEQIDETLRTATEPLGGVYLKDPIWSSPFNWELVTAHPLGGCIMSDRAETGVVNHKCQVFSSTSGNAVYTNLYVCDGSVIPTSLGVNPSLTISALAERCCRLLAEERHWTINYDPIHREA